MSKFVDDVYSTPLSGMRAFREEGRIVIEAGCAGYFCEIDCEGNDDAENAAIAIVDALNAEAARHHSEAYEKTWHETLTSDDYPSASNAGVRAAGIGHLEKQGFKEGDRVKITVRIEKTE